MNSSHVENRRTSAAPFCSECGHKLATSSVKFCSQCGSKVIHSITADDTDEKKNGPSLLSVPSDGNIFTSMWGMDHPVYRAAFMQVREVEKDGKIERIEEYHIPIWFIAIRMLLIFILFVGQHYVFTMYMYPGSSVEKNELYRRQAMKQQCPQGSFGCEYDIPEDFQFDG